MKISFLFFLSLIVAGVVAASEPSAYGAGDLNSPDPYGLTPEEKALLETKRKLQSVEITTKTQDNKVNSLRERIDGLQTIIEGLARKNHANELKIKKLGEKLQNDEINVDEYQKRVEALVAQNTQRLNELNASLVNKFVSKEEFDILVNKFNVFKRLVGGELKKLSKGSSDPFAKLSKAEILKRAERAYTKKRYTKAIEYYKYLLAHNYKPARSSFKLGEIHYYRKDYATALAYYKESAKRYSKAAYMPTLLLHTALSMKYTGDKKNARMFFKALIKKYPSSKAAKIAKKYLQ